MLEGGLAARPDNALIYATSNRRHLVKESISDRTHTVDDINVRDNMQESLSLSDRFGLAVCYTIPSKNDFLTKSLHSALSSLHFQEAVVRQDVQDSMLNRCFAD